MDNFELKGNKNPKILSKIDDEVLKFNKSKNDLADPDAFESFIKATEQMVRKDPRYDNIISELKGRGFNKDVMQRGIDNDKFPSTKIEMHHGPMFTLYDICGIVTDHLLSNDEKVNTFRIANIVLTEHEEGNIQLVMGLTTTNHQLLHDGKIFVHMNQSIGNVLEFIRRYKKGIRREHLYTMEEYIKLCKKYDATDNDYLQVGEVTKKVDKYISNN